MAPGCPDVEACIARTGPGRWLLDNAPEYGFELSFPIGNAQGVTWEPWHWRWVGTSVADPAAMTARTLFARARRQFAASPAVGEVLMTFPAFDNLIVASPRIEYGSGIDTLNVTPPRFNLKKR
jgi:D-alanyl-D-alanine carboxypeptidase